MKKTTVTYECDMCEKNVNDVADGAFVVLPKNCDSELFEVSTKHSHDSMIRMSLMFRIKIPDWSFWCSPKCFLAWMKKKIDEGIEDAKVIK